MNNTFPQEVLTIIQSFAEKIPNAEQTLDGIYSDAIADAKTRFSVYQYAYRARLIGVLAADFPALHLLLGDEEFALLSNRYLDFYPPTAFTVRDLGKHLAQFIQHHPYYRDETYLYELCCFEYAKAFVFDAPDTPIVHLSSLQKIPVTQLLQAKFQFIPALLRLKFNYKTPIIWRKLIDEQTLEKPKPQAKSTWLIWRKSFNPHWLSIDKAYDKCFLNAKRGADFSSICESVMPFCHHDEAQAVQKVSQIVQNWFINEMVAAVDV